MAKQPFYTLLLISCIFSCSHTSPFPPDDARLQKIKLPPGFKISIFASGIDNARSLVMGDKGILFVSTRKAGKVYAIVDNNKDNIADKFYTLISGLNMPNGVAFRKGSLYVAEVNRVIRFDSIEYKLSKPPKYVVVNDSFPTETHHGWKYIAFGPDDKLYVPVGGPCNICERLDDKRFATIMRMNPNGKNLEIYAEGIRNTVGFAWHPQTKELWFTDNGGDWLGDDQPNDELNHAPKKGMHFGYPYCHAGYMKDEKLGKNKDCKDFTPPAIKLGPHVAALGMKFYTGTMFPATYKNQAFIAEHGSWNRSEPIGYRISTVEFKEGKAVSYRTFAEGWMQGTEAWGRPVDVLQLKDGSLLVSDDYADVIYRISYSAK